MGLDGISILLEFGMLWAEYRINEFVIHTIIRISGVVIDRVLVV